MFENGCFREVPFYNFSGKADCFFQIVKLIRPKFT
jgi:hypothetical protein